MRIVRNEVNRVLLGLSPVIVLCLLPQWYICHHGTVHLAAHCSMVTLKSISNKTTMATMTPINNKTVSATTIATSTNYNNNLDLKNPPTQTTMATKNDLTKIIQK